MDDRQIGSAIEVVQFPQIVPVPPMGRKDALPAALLPMYCSSTAVPGPPDTEPLTPIVDEVNCYADCEK